MLHNNFTSLSHKVWVDMEQKVRYVGIWQIEKKSNRIFKNTTFRIVPEHKKYMRLNSKDFHSDVTTLDFDFVAHEEWKPIFEMITAFSIVVGEKRSHTCDVTAAPKRFRLWSFFSLSHDALVPPMNIRRRHIYPVYLFCQSVTRHRFGHTTITVSYRRFDVVVFNNTLHR